jgi:hypothetical protein
MRWLSRLTPLWIALILALCLTGLTMAQGSALVRFVHALPGAGAIDIYVGTEPTVRTLDFGQTTTFINFPAGDNQITVTPAGATTALWTQTFAPAADTASTLIVSSTEPLQFTVFQNDLTALPLGRTRVTAIHAIAGGPAVDVVLEDGRAVVAGLEYNQPYGTLDLPSLVYPLGVVPTGGALSDALLPIADFALNSGTAYTIVAYGTAANPQALVLTAPTAPEGDSSFVRFAHGVPGADAVDIYVDEILVAPSLSFGGDTGFIAIPSGEYTAVIREAGGTEDIASVNVTFDAGDYVTAIALAGEDGVGISAFADDVAAITPDQAAFALFNGIITANPVTLALQDASGASLSDAAAGGEGVLANVAPSEEAVSALVDYGAAAQDVSPLAAAPINGGVYYTVLTVADEEAVQVLELQPVSIAQSVGSAPGTAIAAAAPVEVAVQATPTPTVIPAIDATAIPQAADPNVVQAQPTVAPPAATTAPAGPTARVILDPGANLQLRQYPTRDAFSLGLAPSGTTLNVIGRAGDPAPDPGIATPTVDPLITPTVDPITELPEDQDLVPADTWLNVDYLTPDGGVINAWVNAQFLDVRDPRGNLQRLADLPTVPSNQPGEARDTAVTPPPLPENVVIATVVGLDAGVNLQIRRTPETTGESLALVPNDTALELVGMIETEARDWAFVRYTAPDGSSVTGWVAARFLVYSFRGNSTDLETLDSQGRLPTVPPDRRGALGAGVAGPVAPTQDPLRNAVVGTISLDQGANLHLRRSPDANSESLALMPSGTQLLVTGRTDTNEWVEVEFEGQVGYTSARYVTLTFNGTPYDLNQVPITVDTGLGIATPTATATPG